MRPIRCGSIGEGMVERNLNALLMVILAAVLWGALGFQLLDGQKPCALCLLQRLGMIGVASGALLNVRFGIKAAHYGLSLLFAITGSFVSLRQISLHVCPSFPTFGVPFLGLSLYTWAFIVFVCAITYIALLCLIFDKAKRARPPHHLNLFCRFAFAALFLVTFINIITALFQCGLGAC